jgi:retron-type reverse transcriptase
LKSHPRQDSNLKQKHSNERDVDFNPTPPNGAVSQNDINKLVDSLQCKGKAEYLRAIISKYRLRCVKSEKSTSLKLCQNNDLWQSI